MVFFSCAFAVDCSRASVISLSTKEIYWERAAQLGSSFQEIQSGRKNSSFKPTETLRIVGGFHGHTPARFQDKAKKGIKVSSTSSSLSIKIIGSGKRKSLASRGGNFIRSIISTAKNFLGVPYRWGGTTSYGFDCSGFVMRVFELNGVYLSRTADQQYYDYAGGAITKRELQPGDLVFFTTYCPGISHVGIYIGNDNFIHASSYGGVRINNLREPYYNNRYVGAARY